MNNKISIIVWNHKKNYNSSCIKNLLLQTYPFCEIILLNQYEDTSLKNNNNLNYKIINLPNITNPLLALKTGYENATGNYFLFLEDDIYLSVDYCRTMLYQLINTNADLCFSDWVAYTKNGKDELKEYIPFETIRNLDFCWDNEQLLNQYFSDHGYNFSWNLIATKMIKREVLEKTLQCIQSISLEKTNESIIFSSILFLYTTKAVNCHTVFCSIPKKTILSLSKKTQLNEFTFETINKLFEKKENTYEKDLIHWKNRDIQELPFKKMNLTFSDFGKEYEEFENIALAILSKKTKVVSFDIFDTLLLRSTFEPRDVFLLLTSSVQKKLSSTPFFLFADVRMSAEESARVGKKNREVNLDDIYQCLIEKYHMEENLANEIKEQELSIEYSLSKRRNTGYGLYQIAKLNHKKIIYTSDMYLPKSFIYSLLKKNGYDTDNEIYLSNEHMCTKADGSLYNLLLSIYKKTELIHIGDNKLSDVEIPSNKGIKAYYLPNVRNTFEKFTSCLYSYNKISRDYPYLGIRCMFATVANHFFDYPFIHQVSMYQGSPKFIGYYALGMHLYALTNWIIENSKEKKKIHFVARDGYLLMKSYELFNLYEDNCTKEYNYLLSSREFLFPFILFEKKDLLTISKYVDLSKTNIKKLLSYFPENCINQEYYHSLPKKEIEEKFINTETYCNQLPILEKCLNFENIHSYQNSIKEYLSQIISKNDLLVDIGYNGRTESLLSNLLGYPIDSLYVHQYDDMLYYAKTTSGFKNKCFYDYKPIITGEPREFAFMKNDFSFSHYQIDNQKIIPVFNEKNNTNGEIAVAGIEMLQSNALLFIQDFINSFKQYKNSILFSNISASIPWEIFLQNSQPLDRMFTKDILFDDKISSGTIDMYDNWQGQIDSAQHKNIIIKNNFLKKVCNKLLPKGTKRRKFIKKIIMKIKKL